MPKLFHASLPNQVCSCEEIGRGVGGIVKLTSRLSHGQVDKEGYCIERVNI